MSSPGPHGHGASSVGVRIQASDADSLDAGRCRRALGLRSVPVTQAPCDLWAVLPRPLSSPAWTYLTGPLWGRMK